MKKICKKHGELEKKNIYATVRKYQLADGTYAYSPRIECWICKKERDALRYSRTSIEKYRELLKQEESIRLLNQFPNISQDYLDRKAAQLNFIKTIKHNLRRK